MRSSLPAVVLPVAIVLAASLMGRGATRAQTTALSTCGSSFC